MEKPNVRTYGTAYMIILLLASSSLVGRYAYVPPSTHSVHVVCSCSNRSVYKRIQQKRSYTTIIMEYNRARYVYRANKRVENVVLLSHLL